MRPEPEMATRRQELPAEVRIEWIRARVRERRKTARATNHRIPNKRLEREPRVGMALDDRRPWSASRGTDAPIRISRAPAGPWPMALLAKLPCVRQSEGVAPRRVMLKQWGTDAGARRGQGEDPTVDDVFYNTLSARPLFVDYARGVVIKLDAGDLAVVLVDDYFNDVDYINLDADDVTAVFADIDYINIVFYRIIIANITYDDLDVAVMMLIIAVMTARERREVAEGGATTEQVAGGCAQVGDYNWREPEEEV
nr:unnamed protein product [Digitaria exilis]